MDVSVAGKSLRNSAYMIGSQIMVTAAPAQIIGTFIHNLRGNYLNGLLILPAID